MSGLVGKGIRSYKKANVSDSNNPALGFRNFIMAFEVSAAVGADIAIELANDAMPLTPPAEMVANGFQAPSNIEIINAQLGTFRNNVTVTSNLNGILIDRVSYTLTDTTIAFDDGLNAGEIIVIKRGNEVVNGNRIVDARPLRASGTVDFSTIGSSPVIFEVGEGFRIAPSTTATGGIDNRQIGFVQVFVDGVLQARNVGNLDQSMLPASEQSGNYREVIVDGLGVLLDPQNGVTANAIEFNQFQPFSAEEGVIVISTNLIVDSPNSTGVIDQLSTLQSQITQNDTELARIPTPVGGTPADIIQVNAGGTAYELVTPSSGGGGAIAAITVLFNAGPHTVPVPANFSEVVGVRIRAAGAGGSGEGGGTSNNSHQARGGAGGGAGQFQERYLTVGNTANDISPSATSLTVQIGTGGPSVSGSPQSSGTIVDPSAGNGGSVTSVSGPRGSDQTTITFSTWIGGIAAKYHGETNLIDSIGGFIRTNLGGNGGDTGYGRGGAGGFGNNGGADSAGGGGGGGAGWFDGSDGGIQSSTGGAGGASGTGGNGGMVIEWLTIQISQIG